MEAKGIVWNALTYELMADKAMVERNPSAGLAVLQRAHDAGLPVTCAVTERLLCCSERWGNENLTVMPFTLVYFYIPHVIAALENAPCTVSKPCY